MKKFKVTVWPENKVIEVDEKTSLLKALKDNEFLIKSSCGGMASCGDCKIKVPTGESNLEPTTFGEMKLLGNVFHITKERLSCQTKLKGDITIDISQHEQVLGADRPVPRSYTPPKKVVTKLRKKTDIPDPSSFSSSSSNHGRGNHGKSSNPQQKDSWYRHWDKDKDRDKDSNKETDKDHQVGDSSFDNQNDHRQKKLGGNRRPKSFNYHNKEEDQE